MSRTFTTHLLLRVAPTIALMLLATGVLAFFSCRNQINHVYDMQMANDANVLWSLVDEELHEEGFKNTHEIAHDSKQMEGKSWSGDAGSYGTTRMFRIWHANKVVMRSDTAFSNRIPRQHEGFADVVYKNTDWRVFTMQLEDGTAVEVGEQQELRNGLVRNILTDLFLPLALMIPLVGIGLWAGIKQGIKPIQMVVRQIHRRNAEDLTDITADGLPRDLQPLGSSINRLFERLSKSISAERRFTDHAAHQLRTPLAGSRLLIQMLKTTDNAEEQSGILNDLEESNAHASNMVQKLLIAARVSHQVITLEAVQLYPVVARVLANIGPIALEKNITLSLEGDEHIRTLADETLLELLAQNIIENAVKYTPNHGKVAVTVEADGQDCRLTVVDTGDGIPEAQRTLVFDRFYRVSQDHEGSGIGLAIVADIVQRLNGSIALSEPKTHRGLEIAITLPMA